MRTVTTRVAELVPGRSEALSASGPVFDIDAPVAVQGTHDGVCLLVVPPLKARDSIRIARRLARGGFADPAWAATFISRVRAHPCTPTATVLRLTVPLNAEPGARPGHTTVAVGRDMSFDQSCRLAWALGPLIDSQQRAVSKRRHEWRVRPFTAPSLVQAAAVGTEPLRAGALS